MVNHLDVIGFTVENINAVGSEINALAVVFNVVVSPGFVNVKFWLSTMTKGVPAEKDPE
jgi:hypothetical protein